MFLDKTLSTALIISTIVHTLVFLPFTHLFKTATAEKVLPALIVTYVALKKAPPLETQGKKEIPPEVKEVKYNATNNQGAPNKIKSSTNFEAQNSLVKKTPETPAIQQSKVEIPPELPKEKEGLYLNYYGSIRDKIRSLVLKNYPYYIACGEVCLYFILSADGTLKEIRIIEERSSQNQSLKEIAKRSVQQAAPFFAFPKGLNQAQLSFNVIISFELED